MNSLFSKSRFLIPSLWEKLFITLHNSWLKQKQGKMITSPFLVNFWNLLCTYHFMKGYLYFLFLRNSFMCFGVAAAGFFSYRGAKIR